MKFLYNGYLYESIETVDKIQKDFNRNFWNYPETLYHATSVDNVDRISKEGLNANPNGRRSVVGGNSIWGDQNLIFTVTEDAIGDIKRYGSIIIEINTKLMLNDGFTPLVSLDADIAELYASSDDNYEIGGLRDNGQFPETVVIHVKNIPLKYLKIPKKGIDKITLDSYNLPKVLGGQFGYAEDNINKILKKNVDKLSSFAVLDGYRFFLPIFKKNHEVLEGIKSYILNQLQIKIDIGSKIDSEKLKKMYVEYYGIPDNIVQEVFDKKGI